jgi:hypothetical protein
MLSNNFKYANKIQLIQILKIVKYRYICWFNRIIYPIMKKLYFFLLLFIGSLTFASAQDLGLDHATLDYSGPADQPLSAELTIVNQSTNTLDVIVDNNSAPNLTPGHYAFFCWLVCYDTLTTVSPDMIQLAPGQSTHNFVDHVVADTIPGHDDITYRFYDKNGNSDTLSVLINYDFMPVGVTEISSSTGGFSFGGANPAISNATINYYIKGDHSAKLIVSNLLGSKVAEIPLNAHQNTLTLSVKDFNAGIYIYSLYVDGKVVTSKKLVVAQH